MRGAKVHGAQDAIEPKHKEGKNVKKTVIPGLTMAALLTATCAQKATAKCKAAGLTAKRWSEEKAWES